MTQPNPAEAAVIDTVPVQINGQTVYMPRKEATLAPIASSVCWMFDHPQETLHIGGLVLRVAALAGILGASVYFAFDGSRRSRK